MGWNNSTSGSPSLPPPSSGDEYDPNYVAGGDANQLPTYSTSKTPKWKQYMSDMGQGVGQNESRSGGNPMWSGIGHAAGAGIAKLIGI